VPLVRPDAQNANLFFPDQSRIQCSQKIDVLGEIVSAAYQVIGSGKLNNTIQCDKYDVDEDGSEDFTTARMIASKMVEYDGRMMKGEEKRGGITARAVVFCKWSSSKCAEQW